MKWRCIESEWLEGEQERERERERERARQAKAIADSFVSVYGPTRFRSWREWFR